MNMNERKPANAAEEIIQLYSKYTLEKIFKSYNTIDHILNDWNNCNSDDHYIFMNWLKSNFTADQDVIWFYKKSAKVIGANTIDIFVFMKEIQNDPLFSCRFVSENIPIHSKEYNKFVSSPFPIYQCSCIIPVYLDYDKIVGKKNE